MPAIEEYRFMHFLASRFRLPFVIQFLAFENASFKRFLENCALTVKGKWIE